jgi:hypothetical protein
MQSPTPRPVSHSAAGPLAGFLHQVHWALVILLRAGRNDPTIGVRIEHLDDVEIVDGSDGAVIIQVKSSMQGRPPPVTDTARDLWSTLRVWADYVRLNPRPLAREQFILFTSAEAAPRSAASILRFGAQPDAITALAQLDAVANRDEGTTNTAAYAVWRALSVPERLRILSAMTVVDAIPPLDDVNGVIARELLTSMPGDAGVDRLRDGVLGWWMGRVARHIQSRGDDVISFEEVVNAVRIRVDDLATSELPIDDAIVAYTHELESGDEAKVFVRQLRIIGAQDPRVLQAIVDYFRAKWHVDRWLREELFPPEHLARYHGDLTDRWSRRRSAILDRLQGDENEETLSEVGRRLLAAVMSQQVALHHDRAEEWIMTGTYHDLADNKRLGWHPDYEQRL